MLVRQLTRSLEIFHCAREVMEGKPDIEFSVVDPRLSAGRGIQFSAGGLTVSLFLAVSIHVLKSTSTCTSSLSDKLILNILYGRIPISGLLEWVFNQAGVVSCLCYGQAFDAEEKVGEDGVAIDNGGVSEAEIASIHTPIGEENVGFKLLQKMGWKEGAGLGRNEDGRL